MTEISPVAETIEHAHIEIVNDALINYKKNYSLLLLQVFLLVEKKNLFNFSWIVSCQQRLHFCHRTDLKKTKKKQEEIRIGIEMSHSLLI